MHEGTIVKDLVREVNDIAATHHARRVIEVALKVGTFSHVSAAHMQEHWDLMAKGTLSQDATIRIDPVDDQDNPDALEIVLTSVEIET